MKTDLIKFQADKMADCLRKNLERDFRKTGNGKLTDSDNDIIRACVSNMKKDYITAKRTELKKRIERANRHAKTKDLFE